MLTMIQASPARVQAGVLRTERAVLEDMQTYLREIRVPIVSVHPQATDTHAFTDPVDMPIGGLGFRVMPLPVDTDGNVAEPYRSVLESHIKWTRFVYGSGMGAEAIARQNAVPHVQALGKDADERLLELASAVRDFRGAR